MWIQRSPGASTISARASWGSGGEVSARDRAERRPILGLGRFGMARTERILERGHRPSDLTIGCRSHSSTHPEGWREWPDEAPPTTPSSATGTVAIPTGSKTNGLGDAVMCTPPGTASTASTRAEDSPHAGRCPEVQGMFDDLPARGALRLRSLLRPARGF